MFQSILRSTARVNINTLLKQMFNEHELSSKNMPTAAAHTGLANIKPPPPQLRRDKQQAGKKKSAIPPTPGTVNLQVLGAGANGAPSAVYLFTDQSRYLFNCGEGTQRLAHEHKTKLSRLEHIFVTRNTWTMMGGLPGLALTVQDAGVRQLALHGPPHLDSILQSMKRFVVLKALQVQTQDSTQIQVFEDAVMAVQSVPLYSSKTCEHVVIAYICQLKPRPGPLNLEKCVEKRVPPGPLLGMLKNGIDVTLENGELVRSQDVSEPGETPLNFIFLDVPSEDYLPALESEAERFLESEQFTALVVHFTTAQILHNNCYQSFVQKFTPSTQHLYLHSEKNNFSGYIAAHRIQYQLNQLHPRIFPLLGESLQLCNTLDISHKLKKTKLVEENENGEAKVTTEVSNQAANVMEQDAGINTLTNFHLRPHKGLDHTFDARLNPSEYIDECQALPEFPALLSQLQSKQSSLNDQLQTANSCEYPKIIFLGTGSCIPNKTRNVSAILVQPNCNSNILLDCGEGTFGQIVRFFGKNKARDIVHNLHAIYISHLHADHHIGLIGLLNERQKLLEETGIIKQTETPEKCLLFAPKQIQPWLKFYDEQIERINHTYELIGNGQMLQEALELSETHPALGINAIGTCLVRHCPHSFGVSLTIPSAEQLIKITYSGDSMPCRDLVELGRNSTILIHEATMEDDLVEEAKLKMHSTISQAIEQGRLMKAQHIILTHFSQRYAKLPRMQQINATNGAVDEVTRNVSIAFDNMQVTLEDLPHFNQLYPSLKALFAEHAEELEQKALKRELKLERKRKLLNIN